MLRNIVTVPGPSPFDFSPGNPLRIFAAARHVGSREQGGADYLGAVQ